MTSRRFSEFDNLNKKLREMFPNESKRFDLDLGAKKFFGNKSQLFIRKRGEKLMRWLSIVVSSDFLQSAQGAEKVIAKFLWQGAYEKVGLKVTTRVLPKLRRRGSSDTGVRISNPFLSFRHSSLGADSLLNNAAFDGNKRRRL